MFPNLSSIVLSLLFPYLYILFTYIDYNKSKKDYFNFRYNNNKSIFDAYPNVFRNIIIVTPLTILTIFNLFEIEVLLYNYKRELFTFITHILWSDIYYWTFHIIAHNNKFIYKYFHKKHHEFRNSIGFMAFYADILEIIFLNLGATIIYHIIYKFSMYHLVLFMIIGTFLPIMSAHTSTKIDKHQIHHLKYKYNYGFSIFMDKLMNTEMSIQTYKKILTK